jgi:hypothetical protein
MESAALVVKRAIADAVARATAGFRNFIEWFRKFMGVGQFDLVYFGAQNAVVATGELGLSIAATA